MIRWTRDVLCHYRVNQLINLKLILIVFVMFIIRLIKSIKLKYKVYATKMKDGKTSFKSLTG
jgi:hypothetical protein